MQSSANLKLYYAACFSLLAGIIIFGGLLAPTLELKLGLGGTSYEDFIRSVHLPMQLSLNLLIQEDIGGSDAIMLKVSKNPLVIHLHSPELIVCQLPKCSQVDPIVASFSGGAVGVISSLMIVEINNVKQQEKKDANTVLELDTLHVPAVQAQGALVLSEPVSTVNGGRQPLSPPKTERCSNCSGAGKVRHLMT
ncbi:Protein ORANGE-GREEN, chloroplastic [Vitis vinifera]|uniref:Protein ORANGE-GREEN, chloroplastic n=1 Tax=Vitis vinifera TaxID=29760 RepID=A0A438IND6_VITVI|nr:Protein ORANGE-GREEN, chloroplastic [Vitis vinifera]